MDAPVFRQTLSTLGQYAEIHYRIARGGTATPELAEASLKLEVAMAKMINKMLETEGQVA